MKSRVSYNRNLPQLPTRPIPEGPEIQAWVALVHSYHRIVRQLERSLDEHSLSLSQFEVLANLYFYAGIRQNDLARQLLVTKGNVCGLLDRLASAGLVERRNDPADRRANQLYLTASGTRLLEAALPVHLRIIGERLGTLPAEKLETLSELLVRLEQPDETPTTRPGSAPARRGR